jgi:flagellar protein FlgJ
MIKVILWVGVAILAIVIINEIRIASIKDIRKRFIERKRPIARDIERRHRIREIISLSQAALESGWGASRLSVIANNFFGVIAGDRWIREGRPFFEIPTREFKGGRWIVMRRPFRRYFSAEESFEDWARLMMMPRYREALRYARAGDVRRFGEAVFRAGYATDPDYARKIADTGRVIKGLIV